MMGSSMNLFRSTAAPVAQASGTQEDEERNSKYQLEVTQELVRMIIVGCDGRWDELVGGFKPDGSRFVS